MKTYERLSFIIVGLILGYLTSYGQNPDSAITLSHQSKYAEAENIFSVIDTTSYLTKEQKLARGYNFSWWGQYSEAEKIFKELISEDQICIDALNGLANNYRFNNEYSNAVQYFQSVLKQQPDNLNALKGIVFSYLELNNTEPAGYYLKAALGYYPDDEELYYASGLMHLKNLDTKRAKQEFEKSLSLNASFQPSIFQMSHFISKPSKFIITPWAGYSKVGNLEGLGMRRLDLFYNSGEGNAYYFVWDKSLQLENRFLIQNNLSSTWYNLGAVHRWNDITSSNLKIGYNQIDDFKDRKSIRLEQNFFLGKGMRFMSGIQFEMADKTDIRSVSLAAEAALLPALSLEFQAHNTVSLLSEASENQYLIIPKFYPAKNFEIVGAFILKEISIGELPERRYPGGYLLTTFPITTQLLGKILFMNQKNPEENLFTIVGGVSVKL